MSYDLNVINSFTCDIGGITYTGKQATSDDLITDPFTISITGSPLQRGGTLADSTVTTIYTAASDIPATFLYAQLWADADIYMQLIGSATHAIVKCIAYVPFTIPNGKVLGVASTTVIAAEPTVTALSKIVLGNYSGGTCNWRLSMFL